ncbi:bifunctional oligoribonuclease/PAP phosphatase NrnA [Patescibacteria group bacterium]|nr:bifunctional oligoribonuclease/PAP phosphatase NrnA [Patescibacteria group bacterium]
MHFSKVTTKSAKIILDSIKKSKNILLHLHPSPDGDSVGSTLAMYHFLKNIGKKVTLIKGDSSLPQYLSSLPGFQKISKKNFFQIDLNKFDLFFILYASSKSRISQTQKIIFPKKLITIVIDHHPFEGKFTDISLTNTSSSATCQLVYKLFQEWKAKITPKIAINLFIGIFHDTGGFKYFPMDYNSFNIISKLSKICPNFTDYIFEMENNNKPEEIFFKALALNSLKMYFKNNVVISALSLKKLQKNKLQHANKSNISNILKSVTGWNIGICIVEVEPNLCNLSMRTRDSKKYDLSKIATALGGGGHPTAAGAQVKKSLPQVKKLLLKTIQSLHPSLGQP